MLDLTTEAAGQLTMVEVEYYQATATCSGPHSEAKRPDLELPMWYSHWHIILSWPLWRPQWPAWPRARSLSEVG